MTVFGAILVRIFPYLDQNYSEYVHFLRSEYFFRDCRVAWKSFQSSSSQMFHKIVVLKNFIKYTRKDICRSLFFNKIAGLKRRETPGQVLSCKFCKNFKNTYFMKYLRVATSENQAFWNALTDNKYWMLISKLHFIALVGEEKFPHC